MSVISLISPKGGTGKSTTANILATGLAIAGSANDISVCLIDADPNQPQIEWANLAGEKGNMPDNLTVIGDVSEATIIDRIEEEEQRSDYVIVDLEGTASMLVSDAMSRSDLVLIPLQASQLDANQAVRALGLIHQVERRHRVKINHAVVFTRTSPLIKTTEYSHLRAQLDDNGIPVLDVEIHERAAYKSIFSLGATLADMGGAKAGKVDKAVENANGFVANVISVLNG